MGLLESCEGETGLKLQLDERLFRDSIGPRYSSEDYFFKSSNVKLYGDLLYKKGMKTEFILQTFYTNRGSRVINHSLKIFQNAQSFLDEKGNKIKIETPVSDPNLFGEEFLIGKIQGKSNELIIKYCSFNHYEQQKFKVALYEVAMMQKCLRQQNNRFGYVYSDAFVVESGLEKDTQDKCLIIFGQSAVASLYECIQYRKLGKNPWTESQYNHLCYSLIRSVIELHKQKIAHRDIRPHNFIYSPSKQNFILAGFQNAVPIENDPKVGYNLCGVPYYLPSKLIEIGKREDFSQYYNYSPYKADIYALGVTLLNCLFLDQFTPPHILADSLKKYYTKWAFLKWVKQMVSENPPQLQQVLSALGQDSFIQQRSSIESMRFRMKPQDNQFVGRKKIIAQSYYSMFMYDQWVQQINQVVNYYQMNKCYMQLGDVYKQIADIYYDHDQIQMMHQYYAKACNTYLIISQECIDQNKTEEGIKYLEKGIDCNRKGERGQPNQELASLLNKLALAYHKKGDYEISRAFQEECLDIIAQVHTTNSPAYAQMLIDSARIETEFQEFKQAENMLKAGLKIIEKQKQQTTQQNKIKIRLLQALGSNYRMKALERREKGEIYRKRGEQCLLDALQLAQTAEGNISPLVGTIMMSLGNIYFDKRDFEKSKKTYQKSLIIKQHVQGKRQSIEVGECLTYLANSEKCLRQFEKAIKHYDEAIEVFRRAYGNDHNENTAVAIGNLGLVYKQMGQREQQREYLSLAKTILKDLFGQQCPDYQVGDEFMLMDHSRIGLQTNMPKQVIINMTDAYPFGECAQGDDQSIKVLVRRQMSWGAQPEALIQRAQFFRRLNQSCIIHLQQILEQEQGLHLLYEYVPIRMLTWISNINQKFIESFCRQLIELGEYLAKCFINVTLSLDNVGMDENYRPKYFLDLNFQLDEALDKNQLKNNYHSQILNLFKPYVQSKIIPRPYRPRELPDNRLEGSPSRALAVRGKPDNYSTSSTYRLKQKAVALQKERKNESINVMSSNWDMVPAEKNRKQSILSSVSNVKINRLGRRMQEIKSKLRNIYSPEPIVLRHEQRSIEKNPNSIAFNWDSTERVFTNSLGTNQDLQPKAFCNAVLRDLQQQETIFQKFEKNLVKQLKQGIPMKKNESLKAKEYEQMKKSDDGYFKDFFQVLEDKPKALAIQSGRPLAIEPGPRAPPGDSGRALTIQAGPQMALQLQGRFVYEVQDEKVRFQKPGLFELQSRVKNAINKSKKLINRFKGDK